MNTEQETDIFADSLRQFTEAFRKIDELGACDLAMMVLNAFDIQSGSPPVETQIEEAITMFRKWKTRENLKKSAESKLTPAELAALFGKDYVE